MPLRKRKRNNGDSAKALDEAEKAVQHAKERNTEVYQVAGELKRLRERNHFADQIWTIMRGNPPPRGSGT